MCFIVYLYKYEDVEKNLPYLCFVTTRRKILRKRFLGKKYPNPYGIDVRILTLYIGRKAKNRLFFIISFIPSQPLPEKGTRMGNLVLKWTEEDYKSYVKNMVERDIEHFCKTYLSEPETSIYVLINPKKCG